MTSDEITRFVDVPLSATRAWEVFVQRFPDWWPREHCFCGEAALKTVFIDPVARAFPPKAALEHSGSCKD